MPTRLTGNVSAFPLTDLSIRCAVSTCKVKISCYHHTTLLSIPVMTFVGDEPLLTCFSLKPLFSVHTQTWKVCYTFLHCSLRRPLWTKCLPTWLLCMRVLEFFWHWNKFGALRRDSLFYNLVARSLLLFLGACRILQVVARFRGELIGMGSATLRWFGATRRSVTGGQSRCSVNEHLHWKKGFLVYFF